MRTNRKVIAFILTLVLVMGSAGTAFAGTVQATSQSDIVTQLAEQMRARENNISIYYVGDDVENIVNFPIKDLLYSAFRTTNDDYLKYNWTNFQYNYQYTTGAAANLTIGAIAFYYDTKAEEDALSAKVTAALAQIITPEMTELQKITAIHKYVVDNVEYDSSLSHHSAYDGLIGGKTVCRGYALLMEKMCEEAGIQSIIVEGSLNGVGHAWNIVKIDGVYYQVDATNDDSYNNMFFLVSDEVLTAYKFNWVKANYPACGISITPTSTTPAINIIPNPVTPAVSIIPTTPTKQGIKIVRKNNSTQVLAAAETLVTLAEQSPKAIYVTKAMQYVNMLTDSPEKTDLLNRLNAISTQIDSTTVTSAQSAIDKARSTLNMADVAKAEKLIVMVQNTATRNDLKAQLEEVRQDILIISAETAVTKAETTLNATYIKNAQKIVDSLMASPEKDAFNARLTGTRTSQQTSLSTTAESYVVKAETTPSVTTVSNAERAISVLSAGSVKTSLVTRINAVKAILVQTALQNATSLVSQAETLKTWASYTTALRAVATLPTGSDKTALLNRLSAVKVSLNQ